MAFRAIKRLLKILKLRTFENILHKYFMCIKCTSTETLLKFHLKAVQDIEFLLVFYLGFTPGSL